MAEDLKLHKTPRRPPADLTAPRYMSFRRHFVDCGRCTKWHGPYWYAFWREKNPNRGHGRGRMRSAYIGSDARLAEVLARRKAVDGYRWSKVDERAEPLPPRIRRPRKPVAA